MEDDMTRYGFSKETKMTGKSFASWGPRCAGAMAVIAAVAALTACGGSSGSSSADTASKGSATYRADLAFAQCMRTNGMPNFPDPNPSGGFGVSGQLNGNPSGPAAQAHNACQHLLPRGSSTTSGSSVTQAQLNQAVKIAQCLRAHGEPTFPDPKVVNGQLNFALQNGVLGSARFQSAVSACRSLIPKGVNFP
jgi:hypothetical protein